MLNVRKTRNREYKCDQENLTLKRRRRKRQKRKNVKSEDLENVKREPKNTVDDTEEILKPNYEELSLETGEFSSPVTNVDATDDENKFLIITLLQPDDQETALNQSQSNSLGLPETEDPLKLQQTQSSKANEEMQLLPNIKTEFQEMTAEEDFLEPLSEINPKEFEPRDTYGEEQIEICNWIKSSQARVLFESEEGRPFAKCPACNATFFKASSFHRHIATHLFICTDDDSYVCMYCKYANKDGCETFKHLFTHQDQCEVCNMKLSMGGLRMHLAGLLEFSNFEKRDLWGRFVCGLCNVGFDLSHHLEKHLFLHTCTGGRMPQCYKCQALLDNDSCMENHRCLLCPVCDMAFNSVSNLKAHTRANNHSLSCSVCSYQFILTIDYAKHIDLHNKPYHLVKNSRYCLISVDEKSFQCGICGRLFNYVGGMISHIRRDHGIIDLNKNDLDAVDKVEEERDDEEAEGEGQVEVITYETIENEFKCGMDFGVSCNEVLENQEELKESKGGLLCWDRYSINQMHDDKDED